MKKSILGAATLAALAFAGTAAAQVVTYGAPYHGQPYAYSTPPQRAIVAGTQPYYQQQYNTTYVDQYGRQVHVDQYGRHVIVQPNTGNYGITGYDAWGRPVYGNTWGNYAQNGTVGDRDGDGVPNVRDRWPDNRAYW